MSNYTKILITPECVDLSAEHHLCSYALAYITAKRLSVGDYWIAVEYMSWIECMHRTFREPRGIPDFRGYNPQEQKEFDKWLLQQAENEAAESEGDGK